MPALLPLISIVAGAICLVIRSVTICRAISITATAIQLLAGIALLFTVRSDGIQTYQVADWPAPIGITMVADLFSAVMVVLAVFLSLAVQIYSISMIDTERQAFRFESLLQFMVGGVCGSFLTGDLFNLFVWFEVMLNASFVLMALGGERLQIEGALKYVALNLIASTLFLTGIGLLYGFAATLNMADLAQKLPQAAPGLVTTISMLFLAAFGTKAALFPFFNWLPASYHTPPAAISALFAGMLTEVGVYGLIRVFTLLFREDMPQAQPIMLTLAGATMVIGVLGAIPQSHLGRMLCFLVVCQTGFMLMGLGIFTRAAIAASVFYMLHDAFAKANLFLIYGLLGRISGTQSLGRMGGVFASHPRVSQVYLVSALSLAGIPPLSGFFAKLSLIQAGVAAEQYAIVAAAIVSSLLVLYTVLRVWSDVFWKPSRCHASDHRPSATAMIPIALLACYSVVLGIAAEPVLELCGQAADQLMNPSAYVEAVLGRRP